MRKADLEDLAHCAGCVADMTRTVDEVICDGANTPPSYTGSICGIAYLLDFMAVRLDELATEERQRKRALEALPGNDR